MSSGVTCFHMVHSSVWWHLFFWCLFQTRTWLHLVHSLSWSHLSVWSLVVQFSCNPQIKWLRPSSTEVWHRCSLLTSTLDVLPFWWHGKWFSWSGRIDCNASEVLDIHSHHYLFLLSLLHLKKPFWLGQGLIFFSEATGLIFIKLPFIGQWGFGSVTLLTRNGPFSVSFFFLYVLLLFWTTICQCYTRNLFITPFITSHLVVDCSYGPIMSKFITLYWTIVFCFRPPTSVYGFIRRTGVHSYND